MADIPERGIVYLTITGTSAEQGDDGNTGRGNRVHGLIPLCRPLSLEATAGKNPINHVGKSYNVLANQTADKRYREVYGVKEVYKILIQIGKSSNQSLVTDVQTILEEGVAFNNITAEIKNIVEEQLTEIKRISSTIIDGVIELF